MTTDEPLTSVELYDRIVAMVSWQVLTEAADEIEAEGRVYVEWLAKHQEDRQDIARLVGAEDAYKDAVKIVRDCAAARLASVSKP